MVLRIQGSDVEPFVIDSVATATDAACVATRRVKYDPKAGIVTIPIRRYRYERRRIRGGVVRKQNSSVRSRILLRNVTSCEIEDHVSVDFSDEIAILFGIKVEPHVVSFASVQESGGQTLYTLTAGISEIDCELRDE